MEIVPTPDSGAGTFTFAEPPPVTVAPTLNGPDDLSLLVMTSGTTSMPKLVPKTQSALLKGALVQWQADTQAMRQQRPLHVLSYVPLHLAYGRILASTGLASGGSVTCIPAFNPQQVFQWIETFRPSYLSGLPAVLETIAGLAPQYPEIVAHHGLGQINTGGAVLTAPTYALIRRVFGVPIIKIYAMTEVDLIALSVSTSEQMPEYEGQAVRPDDTRIVGFDGTPVPAGTLGEIVVRDASFPGYWHNPEASEEAFFGEFFRTGDEGRIDENGFITIVGRIKEVINSGGAKVSPHEVEAVLKQHPQVQDAVVFGLTNVDVGETVAAAVVGDVTERELRKFAAGLLPFHKVPTRIVRVDAIPIASSGKVQRNKMAEILGLK
jgi:acyl-CoA synthetase (AMP-forming)/AMP-acid ligase II